MNDIQNDIEDSVKRGSLWEGFMQIVGTLAIAGSILLVVIKEVIEVVSGMPLETLEGFGLGECLSGVLGGIMFIFFGFVVTLLTDIRWFLANLHSNSLRTNEYLDYQCRMKQ